MGSSQSQELPGGGGSGTEGDRERLPERREERRTLGRRPGPHGIPEFLTRINAVPEPHMAPVQQKQTSLPYPTMLAPFMPTKRVKGLFNLVQSSLRLAVDPDQPRNLLLTFDYVANVRGKIHLYWFARDRRTDPRVWPNKQYTFDSTRHFVYPFESAEGTQTFKQSPHDGIAVSCLHDQMTQQNDAMGCFPLVIVLTADREPLGANSAGTSSEGGNQISEKATYLTLKKDHPDEEISLRVTRQTLLFEDREFDVCEIYGMDQRKTRGSDASPEDGSECQICLSAPRDVALLPCRHLCFCYACAQKFRVYSNKCPVCRKRVEKMRPLNTSRLDQDDMDGDGGQALLQAEQAHLTPRQVQGETQDEPSPIPPPPSDTRNLHRRAT